MAQIDPVAVMELQDALADAADQGEVDDASLRRLLQAARRIVDWCEKVAAEPGMRRAG